MDRHAVGAIEIIGLADGTGQFTPDLFPGTEESHISGILADAGKTDIATAFNAYVIKSCEAVMLVDAGPRDLMGPTAGGLQDELAVAGVAPSDVTHIVFTHLHPDHVAGSITADGTPVFANAQVMATEADVAFWSDATNFAGAPEMAQQFQQLAVAVLGAYGDRLTQVADNADIVGGVSLIPLPGHTPGHVGVRVTDGDAMLLHVADIFHAQDLQLADPEIAISFDIDPDTARATRKRILDELATDGTVFTGSHLGAPKFATLERAGSGYRLSGL